MRNQKEHKAGGWVGLWRSAKDGRAAAGMRYRSPKHAGEVAKIATNQWYWFPDEGQCSMRRFRSAKACMLFVDQNAPPDTLTLLVIEPKACRLLANGKALMLGEKIKKGQILTLEIDSDAVFSSGGLLVSFTKT